MHGIAWNRQAVKAVKPETPETLNPQSLVMMFMPLTEKRVQDVWAVTPSWSFPSFEDLR